MKDKKFWILSICITIIFLVLVYFSLVFWFSLEPLNEVNKARILAYIWGFSMGIAFSLLIVLIIKCPK